MDAHQIKFILQETRFASDLPPAILEQLAAQSSLLTAEAGTVVFREGTPNLNLYIVRSGRLALEMNVPGRGPVRILTVGPGEMAGWSALLTGGKMTATSIAVEDSELVVAPADNLRMLSETNHDFGFHLMQQVAGALSKRLVATRLQLLDLFAETAPAISPAPAETRE